MDGERDSERVCVCERERVRVVDVNSMRHKPSTKRMVSQQCRMLDGRGSKIACIGDIKVFY